MYTQESPKQHGKDLQKLNCHGRATTLLIGFRPCDFFSSPSLEKYWKESIFRTRQPFKRVVTKEIRAIPEESSQG